MNVVRCTEGGVNTSPSYFRDMEEIVNKYFHEHHYVYQGGCSERHGMSYDKVRELCRLVYNKAIQDVVELLEKRKVDGE